jgi:hypothetical protein
VVIVGGNGKDEDENYNIEELLKDSTLVEDDD